MSYCGAYHPDNMSITCRLHPGNHDQHLGGFPPDLVFWSNENYIAPVPIGDPDVGKRIAARIPSEKSVSESSLYWQENPRKGVVRG